MWHHEWEHFSSHPLSSRLPVIQRARLAPPWYLVTIISLAIRLQATSYEGDNQSIGGNVKTESEVVLFITSVFDANQAHNLKP